MVMVKATADSEAGVMPSEELLAAMGRFNEELAQAGVMLAGEGLQPSAKGARVRFAGDTRTVVDGPFAETKELVAGYWVWNVKSLDEALEWAKRCPNPMPGEDGVLELRPTYTEDDFGDMITDEHRESITQMRKEVASRQKPKAKAAKKGKAKAKATRAAPVKRPTKRAPARAKSKK
jgi:hypothetical protein